MKKVSFWTVLLAAFTIWLMVFSFPTLAKNLRIDRIMPFYTGDTPKEPVMLTIWHIDSFEGGKNSRGSWLSARAKEFEAANSKFYISTKILSEDQAKLIIQTGGELPDMISYGPGLFEDSSLFVQLKERQGILDSIYASGFQGGVLKALPYSVGGYIMLYDEQASMLQGVENLDIKNWDNFSESISRLKYERKAGKNKVNTVYSLLYGKDANTSAKSALDFIAKENIDKNLISPLSGEITPSQAFDKFANNNEASILIGTQRDFFRVANKKNSGKMVSVKCVPMSGINGMYTDLIQYISIINEDTAAEAERFIDYLLSDKVQNKLKDVGLFSVINGCTDLYEEDELKALEYAIQNKAKAPKLFGD